MNISESSLSMKSSLLNDDLLKQRRQNEHYAIFLGVISQFIWAINAIQVETYKKFFPECYSDNSLVFSEVSLFAFVDIYLQQKKVSK